jgi:hypothetical protein
MGMGYGANSAYVVNEDKLKELNLLSYKKFTKTLKLEEEESGFDAQWWAQGEELEEPLKSRWSALQKEFYEKTGLKLYVGYHDCNEEGDRYDEVDGLFFFATGIVAMTEAGTKAVESGLVEKKWWVSFG